MYRLNEMITPRVGSFTTQSGSETKIIYLSSDNDDEIYKNKELIKKCGSKYGIRYIAAVKKWGWFIGDGSKADSIVNRQVKPCVQELEKAILSSDNTVDDNIIDSIDILQDMLSNPDIIDDLNAVKIDTKIIERNLENFKIDLLNSLSSEVLLQKLEPIIKFRRASGQAFSMFNTILIYMQMPNATMVKKKSRWLELNKLIKPNARPLAVFVPKGPRYKASKSDKEKLINKYLNDYKVSTYDELPIGVQELIMSQSNIVINPKSYILAPYFYDISQTEQKPGTEDVVGTSNVDLPWFEEKGEENEDIVAYIKAMRNVIQKSGVQLSRVKDLRGARGVSKSGAIDVLEDDTEDIEHLRTLIHEFTHEILHQKFLQSNNEEFKKYYRGRAEGKARREQQADLTTWIVLKHFGYNLQTTINYVALWGMDVKNAVIVFDTISDVANTIVAKIVKELESMDNNQLNESIKNIHNPGLLNITGQEVAELCGCGDLYQQGVDEKIDEINETFYNLLNKLK